LSNPISKLCSNQLPGTLFNSAVNSKGQLAIESRNSEVPSFSIYDLEKGKLLSEVTAPNLTPWHSLVAIDGRSLILRYFENKHNPDQVSYTRYDPVGGTFLATVDISSIHQPDSTLPELFLPESPGFQTITQFIDQPIVLGCEYFELCDLIIISYYHNFNKGFERKLLVLKNGKEKLHEIQDKEMSGFAPGGFFVFQNRLIFIKNKTEINIYEI